MPIGFNLLLACIAIAPVLILFDGLLGQSLIEVLMAAALAAVAMGARAADVNLAAQTTSRIRIAAAIPVVWMLIQLLPMPFSAIAHPIWNNADEALGHRSFGHISIDLGETIRAIIFYLANVALIIVSVFAARDRRRAALALLVLTAIATLTTALLLVGRWVPAAKLPFGASNGLLAAVSSIGIILSMACLNRAIERAESRQTDLSKPKQNIAMALLCAVLGLLLGVAGLVVSATFNIWLVAAFGVAAYLSLQIARRLGLAGWATATLVATLVIAAAMIVFWRYNASGTLPPVLQFASAPADTISVAQRILADTSWFGTGAGTYAQLLPIYQELGSGLTTPPSTAAAFAIELGWPMTLFVLALGIGVLVTLYRGALARGRDSFYPAAAAAVAVILLLQAFCDASLLRTGIAVLADVIIGLGLAQSVSRG